MRKIWGISENKTLEEYVFVFVFVLIMITVVTLLDWI